MFLLQSSSLRMSYKIVPLAVGAEVEVLVPVFNKLNILLLTRHPMTISFRLKNPAMKSLITFKSIILKVAVVALFAHVIIPMKTDLEDAGSHLLRIVDLQTVAVMLAAAVVIVVHAVVLM